MKVSTLVSKPIAHIGGGGAFMSSSFSCHEWYCFSLLTFQSFCFRKPNHHVSIGSMLACLSFIGLFFYLPSYYCGRIICG